MYIYIYICSVYECIYVWMFVWMYLLSYKTCPPGHCDNTFMATGALGHTHVQLHVAGFQDSKKAQVNTTATSIIIDTNIYIYIYIYTYIYIYIYRYTYI